MAVEVTARRALAAAAVVGAVLALPASAAAAVGAKEIGGSTGPSTSTVPRAPTAPCSWSSAPGRLRNPWRFSFDGNRIVIGDVGQDRREEIDYETLGGGRCTITGGYVVRDPELPALRGRYVYGDCARARSAASPPELDGGRDDRRVAVSGAARPVHVLRGRVGARVLRVGELGTGVHARPAGVSPPACGPR